MLMPQWAGRKEPDREGNLVQDSWQKNMHCYRADLAFNERQGLALLFWCKAVMSDGHDLLFADELLLIRKWQLYTKKILR